MSPRLAPPVTAVLSALALAACQPAARAEPAPTGVGGVPMENAPSPSAPAKTPPPPSSNQAVLAVGEDAAIGNGRLRLLKVVADSRCPKDAQCIWAGEVTLAFEYRDAAGPHAFELAQSRQPSASVGERTFSLASFGACPVGKKAPAECATVTVDTAATR